MGNWYNFFVRYRSLMIQHHDTLGVLIFANPLSHRDASHRVETMESSLTFQSLTLNGRLKGCGNTISLYTGILYSTQCWKISARNDVRRAFQWGKRLKNLNSNLGAQDERGFTCDYISTEKNIYVTPPNFNIAPEKWWVGRLLSFPDGLFSGANC